MACSRWALTTFFRMVIYCSPLRPQEVNVSTSMSLDSCHYDMGQYLSVTL
jgi:hypothetical protein